MYKIGDEVHIDAEDARAGETPHIVRYVLIINLALAIITLSAIWIAAALSLQPAQGWAVSAEEHSLGGS